MENIALKKWTKIYGLSNFNSRSRGFPNFSLGAFEVKDEVRKLYSFAVPSDEALDAITDLSPIVEIGAGTGYWAALLKGRGADIKAYDLLGSAHKHWFPNGLVGEVKRLSAKTAAARYPDRTLLIIWPYMDSMAIDALRAYEAVGGQTIIYVGESSGGCTANDEFFAAVGEHGCYHRNYDNDEEMPCPWPKPTWKLKRNIDIPQWEGLHDELYIFKRV